MPEGSRVGGFPVMESVERSTTGGVREERTGAWNEVGRGNEVQMK